MIWKVDIVVAGIMGMRWPNYLARRPRARLVTVCDTDQVRPTRSAKPHGATRKPASLDTYEAIHQM